MSKKINIVCYGDSNTYGYTPDGKRYDDRYPIIIKKTLGDSYNVNEEGVVGRTTIYSDYRDGRVGISDIEDVLNKYDVIDILVIMLGTNDFKKKNARSFAEYEKAMDSLLNIVKKQKNVKKVLLIAPIMLAENIEELDPEFDHKSYLLSKNSTNVYKKLANKYSTDFFDAKTVAYPGSDGEHFTQDGHYKLGAAVASIIEKEGLYYEI